MLPLKLYVNEGVHVSLSAKMYVTISGHFKSLEIIGELDERFGRQF